MFMFLQGKIKWVVTTRKFVRGKGKGSLDSILATNNPEWRTEIGSV